MRVREERSSAKMGATVPVLQPDPPVARADSAAISPGTELARGRGASGALSSFRCFMPRTPTWSRGGRSAVARERRDARTGRKMIW